MTNNKNPPCTQFPNSVLYEPSTHSSKLYLTYKSFKHCHSQFYVRISKHISIFQINQSVNFERTSNFLLVSEFRTYFHKKHKYICINMETMTIKGTDIVRIKKKRVSVINIIVLLDPYKSIADATLNYISRKKSSFTKKVKVH